MRRLALSLSSGLRGSCVRPNPALRRGSPSGRSRLTSGTGPAGTLEPTRVCLEPQAVSQRPGREITGAGRKRFCPRGFAGAKPRRLREGTAPLENLRADLWSPASLRVEPMSVRAFRCSPKSSPNGAGAESLRTRCPHHRMSDQGFRDLVEQPWWLLNSEAEGPMIHWCGRIARDCRASAS
jgi:hypothetical protein